MAITQNEKAARFRALHTNPGTFVIPNPWDAGSARLLASLGFSALATSSGAAAAVLGRRDGQISRDEAMHHVATITAATTLPVSADLENGFGADPATVAETIRRCAAAGAVGGSIEDATRAGDKPGVKMGTRDGFPNPPAMASGGGPASGPRVYDFGLAVERVAAAAEAARALPFPFTLTARAEAFLYEKPDLADVIARLQAFERAGADVLFAPGLPDLDAVRSVCQSVSRPVNFMIAIRGRSFSITELASAGVKRVSLATSLYRAAMTGLLAAAREIHDQGTCGYLEDTLPTGDLNRLMAEGTKGLD